MNIPPFTLERQYSEIGLDIENAVLNVLQKGQYIGVMKLLNLKILSPH